MTESRKRPVAIVLLGIAVAGMLLAGGWGILVWGEELRELAGEARALAQGFLSGIHPAAYFAVFAVTPAFGVPISLFYLTAGSVFSNDTHGLLWGIALSWLAIGVNIAVGYWLAASFLKPTLARLVRSRGYEIPKASPENEGRIIVVVRLSPLPFPVQNWVLGIARFRFFRYMLYSWPLQSGIGTGMILVGDSLLRGGTGIALFGLFLIVLFFVIAQASRRRYKVMQETTEP